MSRCNPTVRRNPKEWLISSQLRSTYPSSPGSPGNPGSPWRPGFPGSPLWPRLPGDPFGPVFPFWPFRDPANCPPRKRFTGTKAARMVFMVHPMVFMVHLASSMCACTCVCVIATWFSFFSFLPVAAVPPRKARNPCKWSDHKWNSVLRSVPHLRWHTWHSGHPCCWTCLHVNQQRYD